MPFDGQLPLSAASCRATVGGVSQPGRNVCPCLLPHLALPDLPELTPPTVEARLQQQVEGLRQAVEAANAVLQARVAALASELVSVKTSVAAAVASASAAGGSSGGSVAAASLDLLQEQAAAAAAATEQAAQPTGEQQHPGSVIG